MDLLSSKPEKPWQSYQPLFKPSYCVYPKDNDTESLNSQCKEFLNLVEDKNTKETDIKRFIQTNNYIHIPASLFKLYNFGHHDAYVIKEFKLGTNYIADYLLIGKSSDGYQFVFVECESVYGRIVLDDGNFGESIRKGINQINDWKSYIESNWSTINSELMKYSLPNINFPKEFYNYDSTRIRYLVISGRRIDYTDTLRQRARRSERDDNITIKHYDNWYDMAIIEINSDTY